MIQTDSLDRTALAAVVLPLLEYHHPRHTPGTAELIAEQLLALTGTPA